MDYQIQSSMKPIAKFLIEVYLYLIIWGLFLAGVIWLFHWIIQEVITTENLQVLDCLRC